MTEQLLNKQEVHNAIKSGDPKRIVSAYREYFKKSFPVVVSEVSTLEVAPWDIFDGKLPSLKR